MIHQSIEEYCRELLCAAALDGAVELARPQLNSGDLCCMANKLQTILADTRPGEIRHNNQAGNHEACQICGSPDLTERQSRYGICSRCTEAKLSLQQAIADGACGAQAATNRSLWAHTLLIITALLLLLPAVCRSQSREPQNPTDWDLYMLKLVNDARTDPASENERQQTSYSHEPAGPLAYQTRLGRMAQNHTEWMSANQRLQHHETASDGSTGEGSTIGWSGDTLGPRVNYVGYRWTRISENILRGSPPKPIDADQTEHNFRQWWTSDGHRAGMMRDTHTAFGHHVLNDDDGQWATQIIGQPKSPYQHIFGVVYADMDDNGKWTPRDYADPLHEGLPDILVEVLRHDNRGRPRPYGTTETLANGSFAVNLGYGTYDVLTEDGRSFTDIVVRDDNIDLGDLAVDLLPGDSNRDLRFDQLDLVEVLQAGKYMSQLPAYWTEGDWTGDQRFDQADIVAALSLDWYSPTSVRGVAAPEPAGSTLRVLCMFAGFFILRPARHSRLRLVAS